MKYLVVISILFASINTISLNNSDNINEEAVRAKNIARIVSLFSQMPILEKVGAKTVEYKKFYAEKKDGEVVENRLWRHYEYEYNENGFLEKSISYEKDGSKTKTSILTYADDMRILSLEVRSHKDDKEDDISKTTFEYTNKILKGITATSKYGSTKWKVVYDDEEEKFIETIGFEQDNVWRTMSFGYDENEKVDVYRTTYGNGGKVYQLTYDEKGNLSQDKSFNLSNPKQDIYIIKKYYKEFNAKSDWTYCVYSHFAEGRWDEERYKIEKREIKYYE